MTNNNHPTFGISPQQTAGHFNFDAILPLVNKPSRYCGFEFNAVRKDWHQVELHIALAFPDLYEIGMSHQGLQILYQILNRRHDILAERVYTPDTDLEQILRSKGQHLFSLESRRPLMDFDIIGITLPYELCYSNILTILDLASIPFRAAERDNSHPLVLGGGPCAFHPEPVADFFDAILLGDGEEAVLEIADIVVAAKKEGMGRAELLDLLRMVEGLYVPGFFKPRYDQNGRFLGMKPLQEDYCKVKRRILPSLQGHMYSRPLVSINKIVHDRFGLEIARGCTRGCRFCQAGVIYRPVRERSPEQVLAMALEGINNGGFEELALLSLSTGDYSCLGDVLINLMDEFVDQKVSVSMPSMRVGTLTPAIMEQIKRVRKTGFTLAPEAGSERLRQVINKGITENDLLDTCKQAFGLGWKLIKLYFMFGLPTETWEDLEAIPQLARKAMRMAGGSRCQINVSAATFVPKPHTPFQWEQQLSIDEGCERIAFLKRSLQGKTLKLKWHDPKQSFLEGAMSRGDRRLADVIEEAWRQGARLDAWSDHFDLSLWQRSAEKCGIDLAGYLRKYAVTEPLAWQHLDVGVAEGFFVEELEKSRIGEYTPDCRGEGCQKCGLCDFKIVKPIVFHEKKKNSAEGGIQQTGEVQQPDVSDHAKPESSPLPKKRGQAVEPCFTYKFTYVKSGEARFISHLELIQMFFRVFRRIKLPVLFSKGFNPSPKIAFSPALPVGTESRAEFFLADLSESLIDTASLIALMNQHLPPGIRITNIDSALKKTGEKMEICYHISLPKTPDSLMLDNFLEKEHFFLTRKRKGKEKEIDARAIVSDLSLVENGTVKLAMICQAGQASIKPMELLKGLLGLSDDDVCLAKVVKEGTRELQ